MHHLHDVLSQETIRKVSHRWHNVKCCFFPKHLTPPNFLRGGGFIRASCVWTWERRNPGKELVIASAAHVKTTWEVNWNTLVNLSGGTVLRMMGSMVVTLPKLTSGIYRAQTTCAQPANTASHQTVTANNPHKQGGPR